MSSSRRALPIVVTLMALAALALLTGGSHVSAAKDHRAAPANALHLIRPGYLTVGSDASYPPMESYDTATHKYIGADIDLAQALAHAMGLHGAIIVNNIFSTIIPSLQRRKFDVIMSSMSDTPARRRVIAFIDYMRGEEAIVVHKSSTIHAKSYAGMCGHTIAVESATTEYIGLESANRRCKKKINIHSLPSDTGAYTDFATGHADAYTTDYPVAAYYLRKYPGALRLAGRPFAAPGNYGIGLPKSQHALKSALVRALHKIKANGQYRRILKRWDVGAATL